MSCKFITDKVYLYMDMMTEEQEDRRTGGKEDKNKGGQQDMKTGGQEDSRKRRHEKRRRRGQEDRGTVFWECNLLPGSTSTQLEHTYVSM